MNAITLLKTDHGNVEALFKELEALGRDGDPAEKRRIVDHVIEQLSVHASIEEELLYPALRAKLGADDFPVLEALEEHHAAKLFLHEIEKLPPTHERFDAKVKVLIESVRHHVEEEESELFDLLRANLKAAELDDLGEAMEKAKATAPTRPHPFTPDQPPLQTLISMPVAVLDRMITTGRKAFEDGLAELKTRASSSFRDRSASPGAAERSQDGGPPVDGGRSVGSYACSCSGSTRGSPGAATARSCASREACAPSPPACCAPTRRRTSRCGWPSCRPGSETSSPS